MRIKSTKVQLIVSYLLFAIIPLLIINIFSTQVSKNALRNTSNQLTKQIMEQAGVNLSHYIEETEKSINKFAINDLIQNNLLTNFLSSEAMKKLNAEKKILERIIYTESLDSSLQNISIVFPDNTILGNTTSLNVEDLLTVNEMEVPEKLIWKQGLGNDCESVYLLQSLTFLSNNSKQSCILITQINTVTIENILKEIQLLKSSVLTLSSSKDKLIYSTNDTISLNGIWTLINPNLKLDNFSYHNAMYTYYVMDNGWVLISQIPYASLIDQLNSATHLIWMLILLAGLIAVAIGSIVAKSFATPIMELMKLMKLAESGDLTVRTAEKGNYEMKQLCRSFNRMFDNIGSLLYETQLAVKKTIKDINELASSTSKTEETFTQLSISFEEIAEGTINQADYASDSSNAMSNLSESIRRVIHSTNQIQETNQNAKNMISTANPTMKTLNDSMVSSLAIMEEIRDGMKELTVLNQNVELVLKLLDEISEETNLLSLNASIEAARAGDYGKGFSVVAQEIRALSEQSKESTNIVRSNLLNMSEKTNMTFSLIEKSNLIFKAQENSVKDADIIFVQLVTIMQSIDSNLQEILHDVSDMRSLKDITSQKIMNIASVTEETAASAEQVSALSKEQEEVINHLSILTSNLTETMNAMSVSIKNFILP